MAKVDGPLFSFGASGSIADTMTFSRWKGRPYVRQHVIPSNPKSPSQMGGRWMWKFLSQIWAGLGTTAQATWDERASAAGISPFNAFISRNAKRWTEGEGPTQEYPAAETEEPTLPGNATISGSGSERTLDISWSVDPDTWGLALYGADGAAPTGAKNQCIAVVEATNDSEVSYPISGVPTDYDTFGIRVFSNDGNLHEITALPISP